MKFLRLSSAEKLLFAEAFLLHLGTGLLLKAVPFRRIPRIYRSRQFETPAEEKTRIRRLADQEEDQSRHNVSGQKSDAVFLIREAVARAGRVSPWKNRCLVSSLAARCMLNRRKIPSALSLGMAKKHDGQTTAHAWIKAGDIDVVEMNGEQTELSTF